MAVAVGQSKAKKILLPMSRCNTSVVGVQEMPFGELIKLAVNQIMSECGL